MKNLYKYELNESIAAKATMNCLKNRNISKMQEQEEHPEDYDRLQSQLADAWDQGMADDEDDYVPYENKFDETHNDLVDSLLTAVDWYFRREADVEGFNHFQYTDDQIGKAVEQILDKYGDFPSSNNSNKCHAWVRKHVEELMKILETGSLENSYEGHPEFDFSEQEEMPQMERHDMILALTQYLDESWIDASEDGDLDELYYAVAKVLDRTGDYPASTDWEDCKPWCQKHYREVEETFLGGGFYQEQEENISAQNKRRKISKRNIVNYILPELKHLGIPIHREELKQRAIRVIDDIINKNRDFPAGLTWSYITDWVYKHMEELRDKIYNWDGRFDY